MTRRYWLAPKPGDIVQCRFPEKPFKQPGPKDRPALVTKVDIFENGVVDVEVAYGTSQGVNDVHGGELVVRKSDGAAGLDRDTKFDIRNVVQLPFDDEWFAPDPGRRHGEHPKRGKFDMSNKENKRKLQAAVVEARAAGAAGRKAKPGA